MIMIDYDVANVPTKRLVALGSNSNLNSKAAAVFKFSVPLHSAVPDEMGQLY